MRKYKIVFWFSNRKYETTVPADNMVEAEMIVLKALVTQVKQNLTVTEEPDEPSVITDLFNFFK